MTNNSDFTYQYAIRCPDGDLLRRPKHSDLLGLGGLFGMNLAAEVPPPRIWDTREGAESALADIRSRAADIGVQDWCGTVVQRLCTPFTHADPAEHFVEKVQEWLDSGGE